MDILQLEYFEKVAELQHFGRAAQELYVTQSTVSKAIKGLEQELGTPLFRREYQSVHLNEQGAQLLDFTKKITCSWHTMIRELEEASNVSDRKIHLELDCFTAQINEMIIQFCKEHPDIYLYTYRENTPSISHENGYKISSAPPNLDDCRCTPLFSEEILLFAPRDAIISGADLEDLSFLSGRPFIMPEGGHYRSMLNNICREHNIAPHIAFESNDFSTCLHILHTDHYFAFIPERSWGRLEGLQMNLHRFCGGNYRYLLHLYSPEKKSDEGMLFENYIINAFSQL